MRILSFRATPVAKILAIIYAVFGFAYVPTLLLVGAKEMVLPVGIVAPLVHLNLNLRFPLPASFLSGVLSTLFAAFCYTVTGWLTGLAAVLVFNFVSSRMGGIDASLLVRKSIATEVPS